jgi:hypothetical protein
MWWHSGKKEIYGLFNDALTRSEFCDERRATIWKERRNERSLPDLNVLILPLQELDQTTKYLFQDWDLRPGLKRCVLPSATTFNAVARKQKREGGKKRSHPLR